MKTLVKDNKSIYIFDDAEVLDITADNIQVGEPARFIISDCNSSNITLYTDVTPPEDWTGNKYLFDGTTWTANSDWVDPATLEEQPNE
jgi:hypothetical protein